MEDLGGELLEVGDEVMVYLWWDELSYSYRSWRKIRGLPSRGQRTWSNARGSGSYIQKFSFLKNKIYGDFYREYMVHDFKAALGAEQVNMFWLRQWGHEWLVAAHRCTRSQNSKRKGKRKAFDIATTAKGWVGNVPRAGSGLTKKKKKLLTGMVGFEPGFTRVYLAKKAGYDVSSFGKDWRAHDWF